MKSLDPLESYCAAIREYPILPHDEICRLAQAHRATKDPRPLQKIVSSNLLYVVREAQRHKDFGVEVLDLVSEGNIGLIEAAKRFDPDHGHRFLTFARLWIKSAITDCLNARSRRVRLPQPIVDRLRKISTAERMGGTDSTPEALAKATGLAAEDVEFLLTVRNGIPGTSIDEEVRGTNCLKVGETLPSDLDVHAEVETNDLQAQIESCLTCLSEREAFVVRRQFGLLGCEQMSNEAIGKLLGVCRERVRQIGEEAKERLLEEHCELLRALL